MDDLLQLDVGRVYLKIIQEDKGRKEFGFFPLMESLCKGRIGALNADIFVERVNPIANIIMTYDSTLLTENLLNKLVTLWMNAGFMEHMNENYLARFRVEQPFGMAVVRDNE